MIYFPLTCYFSPTPIGFGKREFALWINQKQCHKLLVTNLTYICIIYMLFLTDSYWIWKEIIFLWINQKQCHKLYVTDWYIFHLHVISHRLLLDLERENLLFEIKNNAINFWQLIWHTYVSFTCYFSSTPIRFGKR